MQPWWSARDTFREIVIPIRSHRQHGAYVYSHDNVEVGDRSNLHDKSPKK